MRQETLKIIKNFHHLFKGEYIYDIGGGYDPLNKDLVGNKKIKVVDYIKMEKVDLVDDMMELKNIKDNSVDNIYCADALEHVIQPWRAIDQFYRVLKPGGIVFLTVPFVWHFHGHELENNNWKSRVDFWRFTPHALESLCHKYFNKVACDWDLEPSLGPQTAPIWRCGCYYIGEKLENIREEYKIKIHEKNW